jgi:hypothetical protein
MWNCRSKLRQTAVVVLLLLGAAVVSPPQAAEPEKNQPGKLTKPESGDRPKTKSEDTKRSDRIFVPSEKISAGKPVSFPTDI